ncbi:hypothetical protein ABPG75_008693 [Micractinium tetrahymenae]
MAAPAPGVHPPPLIVGASGRVGSALLRMSPSATAVMRGQSLATFLDAGSAGTEPAAVERRPILVATTNDALEQVVAGCPAAHRADLVFLQNGMLLHLLERHGLQGSTQALLYFSAGGDGSVVDSRRTIVTGRWAGALSEVLQAGGVACRPVERSEFLALMVEKLLWASIYWLLSAGLGGLPVGRVAQQHGEAAEELAAELLPLAQAYVLRSGAGMGLPPGSLDQVAALTAPAVCRSMAEYSLAIPTAVPSRAMALAEFEWRNGWFLGQAVTPRHAAWLRRSLAAPTSIVLPLSGNQYSDGLTQHLLLNASVGAPAVHLRCVADLGSGVINFPTASACTRAGIPLYDPSTSATAVPGSLACSATVDATDCHAVPLPLANGTQASSCGCDISYAQGRKRYTLVAVNDTLQLDGPPAQPPFTAAMAAVESATDKGSYCTYLDGTCGLDFEPASLPSQLAAAGVIEPAVGFCANPLNPQGSLVVLGSLTPDDLPLQSTPLQSGEGQISAQRANWVNLTAFSIGSGEDVEVTPALALLDTGTPTLQLPAAIVDAYVQAVTAAVNASSNLTLQSADPLIFTSVNGNPEDFAPALINLVLILQDDATGEHGLAQR